MTGPGTISSAIPLEDLGLSSDSANDEDFILCRKSRFHRGSDAILRSSAKQVSFAEGKANTQVSFPPFKTV